MLRTLRLPLQLFGVIVFVALFGSYVPFELVRFFYTLSSLFKEALGIFLPFIVFFFITSGILSIKRGAPLILPLLLVCIFLSNIIVTSLSYLFVRFVLPIKDVPVELGMLDVESSMLPYLTASIPHVFNPGLMLLSGLLLGIFFSFFPHQGFKHGIDWCKQLVEKILLKGFIPLLPMYVFGYLLEIKHRGIMGMLFQHYGTAIALILSLHFVYIVGYFIVATTSFKKGLQALKNALPSYITAVSTISSTATIPVTVECAEKNTGNRPLAEMSVPLMANVHLMGAGINIPILSMATMILFKATLLSPSSYFTFVLYFCTSMFAVTGIPGAGIFVMMPLLITYFDFSPIMISVLTTLYLLMDATSAGANVMGDGALIIIINRILKKLKLA